MFKKVKHKAFIICVLLLGFFIWQSFAKHAQLTEYRNQIVKFKDGEQVFIEKLNEKGEKIAEQEQVILTQKDAIAHNLLEIDRLKEVKSQVKIRTITKIDSVFIPIIDTVERIVIDTAGVALLRLPTKFGLDNEWYSIYSTINTGGLLIDSLSINNRQIITLGMKSNGLFQSPTPTVLIKNENPYVQVSSLSNVVIKKDLKFYDHKGFWAGMGFLGGVLIPAILTK